MKKLSTFASAGVLAVALTVLVAPGIASATALYSGATKLGVGTEIKASATGSTAKIEDTEGHVLDTCSGSSLTAKVTDAGSATATVKLIFESKNLTWTGCSVPTSTTEGAEMEWHWLSALLHGTLTIKGLTINLNTILFGNCAYTGGTGAHWGVLTGSTTQNAVIHVNAIFGKKSGICGSTAVWTGTYTVTSPTPLHVTGS